MPLRRFLLATFSILAFGSLAHAQSYTPTLPDNMLTPADPIGIPPHGSSMGTNESIVAQQRRPERFRPRFVSASARWLESHLGYVHPQYELEHATKH